MFPMEIYCTIMQTEHEQFDEGFCLFLAWVLLQSAYFLPNISHALFSHDVTGEKPGSFMKSSWELTKRFNQN